MVEGVAPEKAVIGEGEGCQEREFLAEDVLGEEVVLFFAEFEEVEGVSGGWQGSLEGTDAT